MAEGTSTRLKMYYTDSVGAELVHTWSHAKSNPASSDITALANGTITNGSIFQKTPISFIKAETVVTTTTDVTPS